jgi:hypothetical protein
MVRTEVIVSEPLPVEYIKCLDASLFTIDNEYVKVYKLLGGFFIWRGFNGRHSYLPFEDIHVRYVVFRNRFFKYIVSFQHEKVKDILTYCFKRKCFSQTTSTKKMGDIMNGKKIRIYDELSDSDGYKTDDGFD